MKVHHIYNKVVDLENNRVRLAKAIAVGLISGSPEHVIESLKRDYERYSKEYFKFMEQDVLVIEEPRETFVIQAIFDGSYVRAIMKNSRTEEESLSMTNRLQYAMTFTSKDSKEYKEVVALIGEEGYDWQTLKV